MAGHLVSWFLLVILLLVAFILVLNSFTACSLTQQNRESCLGREAIVFDDKLYCRAPYEMVIWLADPDGSTAKCPGGPTDYKTKIVEGKTYVIQTDLKVCS